MKKFVLILGVVLGILAGELVTQSYMVYNCAHDVYEEECKKLFSDVEMERVGFMEYEIRTHSLTRWEGDGTELYDDEVQVVNFKTLWQD